MKASDRKRLKMLAKQQKYESGELSEQLLKKQQTNLEYQKLLNEKTFKGQTSMNYQQ